MSIARSKLTKIARRRRIVEMLVHPKFPLYLSRTVGNPLPPATSGGTDMRDREETGKRGDTGKKDKGGDPEHPLYTRVVDPSSTGWPAMYKIIRESDIEKVEDCRDDIDTLLVFAGLYSAVLSAFLIESYKNLQEDKQDTIVSLLERIATQNYVSSGMHINSTTTIPPSSPFEPPLWAIRLNVLWFASLVLSISVASLGILVKQWLREFLASDYSSPRLRLRARNHRRPALDDWKVFEIAAALPMILQISVGLFFAGLCLFTSAVHDSVRDTTIPIVFAWAFFFLITIIAPLFSPRCPFKTTFLKAAIKAGRRLIWRISIVLLWHATAFYEKALQRSRVDNVANAAAQPPRLEDNLYEEDTAVKGEQGDSKILLDVDEVVADDNLFPTMIEVLAQQPPEIIVDFILQLVRRRAVQESVDSDAVYKINALSSQSWSELVDALSRLLTQNRESFLSTGEEAPTWVRDAVIILLSDRGDDECGMQALRAFIATNNDTNIGRAVIRSLGGEVLLRFAAIVPVEDSLLPGALESVQRHQPQTVVDFVLNIIHSRTASILLEGTHTPPLDLRGFSETSYLAISSTVGNLLVPAAMNPDGSTPRWVLDAITILLSISAYDLPKYCARAITETLELDARQVGQGSRLSIADHIFQIWTTTPEFSFTTLTQLYTSLDSGKGGTQRLHDVLVSHHTPGGGSGADGIPFAYPALFQLLTRLLTWRCTRNEELAAGEYEALQAVLDIGANNASGIYTGEVLEAFYRHPAHVFGWMFCYAAIAPLNPMFSRRSRTASSGSFLAFLALFEDPYNSGKPQHSIETAHKEHLERAIMMAEEYCKDRWETYTWALASFDLVRICNLYLHTWVLRVARPAPAHHELSNSPLWLDLWMALARGIEKYLERRPWERPEEGRPWRRSSSRVVSPCEVLELDVEDALDCLHTVSRWRAYMHFPTELESALQSFIEAAPAIINNLPRTHPVVSEPIP